MVRFRCPTCSHSMEHSAGQAGKMGTCERCGSTFVHPTDPLPGMKALPWEAVENPRSHVEREKSAPDTSTPHEPTSQPERKVAGQSAGKAAPRGASRLAQFDTRELLAPLNELGLHAILVAWNPKQSGSLKVGTSSGCRRDEADRKILELALAWIKARSPQLYAKLIIEISRLPSPDQSSPQDS